MEWEAVAAVAVAEADNSQAWVVETEWFVVVPECCQEEQWVVVGIDSELSAGPGQEQQAALDTGRTWRFADAYLEAPQSLPEEGIAKAVAAATAFPLERVGSAGAAVLASVEQLVDDAVSRPAFASASRDFDGSLLAQDRRRGIAHLYNDGNDSAHTVSSHNVEPNTFDLYTRRYASIDVSSQHSEASPNIARLHDDTLLHVSVVEDAAVDVAVPVVDRTLVDSGPQAEHYFRSAAAEEELGSELALQPAVGSEEVVGNEQEPAEQELVAAETVAP
jgi:hypothetical protein